MQRFAAFLKTVALASVTSVVATTATAQEIVFTVHVYEEGYFPNKVYTADATQIEFVNETQRAVGIHTTGGVTLIDNIAIDGSSMLTIGQINYQTIRTPFLRDRNRYDSNGKSLEIIQGMAPDS